MRALWKTISDVLRGIRSWIQMIWRAALAWRFENVADVFSGVRESYRMQRDRSRALVAMISYFNVDETHRLDVRK
jgi:hypothetical protein